MIKNPALKKIALGFSIIFILLCPIMFFAGMFAPRTLGFLDSVMCPEGSYITNYKYEALVKSNQGNTYNQAEVTDLICLDAQGNQTDISGKMLVILFAFPVIAIVLWVSTQKFVVVK